MLKLSHVLSHYQSQSVVAQMTDRREMFSFKIFWCFYVMPDGLNFNIVQFCLIKTLNEVIKYYYFERINYDSIN